MKKGKRTWIFATKPSLISGAAVGAQMEKEGPMAPSFDYFFDDMRAGKLSFEMAERAFLQKACNIALEKAALQKEDIDCFLAGDLMNQIISSSFTARDLPCSYLGQFGACSTSAQALLVGAALIDGGFAEKVLCATVSHNASAEKQFRFPNEYGIQKPPYSQFTVNAAGAGVLSSEKSSVCITAATPGRVIDIGITDAFNLGAAMAPAAFDTIKTHLEDMALNFGHYDLIITGDLGRTGHECLMDMLAEAKMEFDSKRILDGGLLIYNTHTQNVFSGGSGCGCSAAVLFGHYLPLLQQKEIRRLLFVATGALMSPVSMQQGESIPCIAHAVSLEVM